jgi:ABC-type dipeptide/oligopeptide/nickel transport system ATPase component
MCYVREGLDLSREGGQTLAIFGSSYSGKSTLLVFFLQNIVKAKAFDVIILMTESLNAGPLDNLPKEVIKCLGYHPNIVQLAYKINLKTNNRYKFLFVLDDCVNLRSNKTLEKQILLYRNSNISTILSTQYIKTLTPPGTRGSLHTILVTGGKTPESREAAYKIFLRSYLKGYNLHGADEWIVKNTQLTPTGGTYIRIDNVKSDMSVIDRPKIKH